MSQSADALASAGLHGAHGRPRPRLRPKQAASVEVDPLPAPASDTLRREGYLILRQAVPAGRRAALRDAFDAGVGPADQWAAPRRSDWRHALVDLDAAVQSACRAPMLLSAAAQLLGEPFFLSQVEGREPLPGGGFQPLHRDGAGLNAVVALIFLDDYDPDNGATRVVPLADDDGKLDEQYARVLSGHAGDIVVFHADLAHGATRNRSGARRRSLIVSFMPATLREAEDACRAARNVRMDTRDTFVPVRPPRTSGSSLD